MSLRPDPIRPVPEGTARVAKAAFRKGNPLLELRDELGAIFRDEDFARPVPGARPAGTAAVAAGPGHRPAVPREPARPAGGGSGARPQRPGGPAPGRAG